MRAFILKKQILAIISDSQAFVKNELYYHTQETLWVLASLIIPILVYRTLSFVKRSQRFRFFNMREHNSWKQQFSIFFRKISRLWFFTLSLWLCSWFIQKTSLSSYAPFIKLLSLLLLIISALVQTYRLYSFKVAHSHKKKKIKTTLVILGATLFFHTFFNESTYIKISSALTLIFFSWYWRQEIKESIKHMAYIGKYFEMLIKHPLHIVLLPVFLLIALAHHLTHKISSLFSDQEIYQKIANQIMRNKLTDAMDDSSVLKSQIPATYQFLFTEQSLFDKRLFLEFPANSSEKVESRIISWRENKTQQQSFAIVGDRGCGKTTFLYNLMRSHQLSSCQKIYYSLGKKITHPKQINELISKIFNTQFEGGIDAFLELDQSLSPTIVIIDNLHHLFLSQEDGLEAMKYFIRLINAETLNIYWVASFDYHAWSFLNNIMGQKYFFRNQMFLPKWETTQIRKMIKLRHGLSGYSLNFDLITDVLNKTQEYQSQSQESEDKFFNLLAHQAEGTPGLAMSYWLHSVKVESYKKLGVYLPEENILDLDRLQLEDQLLFVYAAILRHVCLTLKQAVEVTSLPKGIVANALKMGREKGFLYRDAQGSYHTVALKQKSLTSYLSKKNFIYE